MTAGGSRERTHRLAVLSGAMVLGLIACGATGWALGRTAVPEELQSGAPVSRVDLLHDEFSDTRTVDLSVALQPSAGMVLRTGGVLTASECEPGAEVVSGGSTFAVDGSPLIDLRTPQPLWRSLAPGSRGADVRSLQEALVDAGFTGSVDGVIGPQTLDYFNQLRRDSEPAAPLVSEISPESVVWLSSPPTRIVDCAASVGQPIDAGTVAASLPPRISTLRVGTMPTVVPDEPRMLVVDTVRARVDVDGGVDADAWAAITGTPAFQAYVADPQNVVLKGTLQTSAPLSVALVPPSALFAVSGDTACVTDGSSSFPATIISAEAGFAVLEFGNREPVEVEISPAEDLPCP